MKKNRCSKGDLNHQSLDLEPSTLPLRHTHTLQISKFLQDTNIFAKLRVYIYYTVYIKLYNLFLFIGISSILFKTNYHRKN